MTLMAIEMSDAGILAAAGQPARRIPVDGAALDSPGYILTLKKKLTVGHAAKSLAHHYPRQIQHRFWDQLSAIPLKQPEPWANNYAEMAHVHLSAIWERIRSSGSSVVMTVPAFFTKDQMGLLLGIAQDLDMSVSGFINQAVAACPHPMDTPHLLHVDAHLHRTEVSLLGQGDRLELLKTLTLDSGLLGLQRRWIEAIAKEFVSATRYDPLHAAASEQALYDQLPDVLRALANNPATTVQTRSDHAVHHISLATEILIDTATDYYEQIGNLVVNLMDTQAPEKSGVTLLLSHRLADWAGFQSFLRRRLQVDIVELPPGAAAKNALAIWDQLERPAGETGAFFFKQRRWGVQDAPKTPQQTEASPHAGHPPDTPLPTHLLYRHIAYSFVHTPLAIIATDPGTDKHVSVVPYDPGQTDILCSVGMEDGDVILRVPGARAVFVDGQKIIGKTTLALGQALQTSEDDDAVRLIACL
jgi:hypothetical protein